MIVCGEFVGLALAQEGSGTQYDVGVPVVIEAKHLSFVDGMITTLSGAGLKKP